MKKKKLFRRISELDFMHQLVQGAIGKEYVIKHYCYGPIRTKFPDMTIIIASAGQRKCRNLFKEAVAYAREIIADPERKKAWQKKLRRRNSVYYAAIKEFMLREKRKKEKEMERARQLIARALNPLPFIAHMQVENESRIFYQRGISVRLADDS